MMEPPDDGAIGGGEVSRPIVFLELIFFLPAPASTEQ